MQGRVGQFWNSRAISLSGRALYVETYLSSRLKPAIDGTTASGSKVVVLTHALRYSFSLQSGYRSVCSGHTVTASCLRISYGPALDLRFLPPQANKLLAPPPPQPSVTVSTQARLYFAPIFLGQLKKFRKIKRRKILISKIKLFIFAKKKHG
jgi:hypothetical protein